MSMKHQSRFHRFIAMLMVIAMPMCCCVLNAAAFGSCCGSVEDEPVMTVSCCSSQQCDAESGTTDVPADSQSCQDSNCKCCLRAPVQSFDWTPPTDTIGSISYFHVVDHALLSQALLSMAHQQWEPPPPRVGISEDHRGLVILQV